MTPTRMSKLEASIRTVLAFNEACNRHDVAALVQLLGEDCVYEHHHPAPDGTLLEGKEPVAQYWKQLFQASPQVHIAIEEIFSLGERCIMRWSRRWEDSEGQKAYLRGVDIFRVRQGTIREQLSFVKG